MSTKTFVKAIRELIAVNYLPEEVASKKIVGLSLDSRKIKKDWLFIATLGNLVDGRDFIPQAVESGAACVFRQSEFAGLSFFNGVPIVDIPDLDKQISAIAGEFYDWPANKIQTVAVTGTNGKTSCVSLTCELVTQLGHKAGLIGTLGYGVWGEALTDTGHTTPDPIACQKILAELVEREVAIVVMEASSHAIAQGRLEAIEFNGLVFTNLSRDHLDYHQDLESYESAKLKLFETQSPDFVVSNFDDETGKKVLAIARENSVTAISYGVSLGTEVYCQNASYSLEGVTSRVQTPWGDGVLQSQLVGEFNLHNLMAVLSVAVMSGYELEKVLSKVPNLSTVNGRMQKVIAEPNQEIQVLLDYAHTPDALEKALSAIPKERVKKIWVVFGCGGDRDTGKRPMMGEIAGQLADCIVITSDNPRSENPQKIIEEIRGGVQTNSSKTVSCIVEREKAIEMAILEAEAEDIVLIAGKGHENYQIIGTEKSFFDDAEVAMRALKKRESLELETSK